MHTTAKTIANHFKVPVDRYFDVKTEKVGYSLCANKGVRRALVTILADAKRKGLIEINYGTKDFTDKVIGVTKKKDIYTAEEARRFVSKVLQEPDIRKRTVFSLMIFMGLRSAEICGLEWQDIDFENQTVAVNRVYNYFGKKFGSQEKEPKSEKSKRMFVMPPQLVAVLKEYKTWWEEQKIMHGDLWANTDKLMVRDNGKTRVAGPHAQWLKEFQYQHDLKHISPHLLRHTNITMQEKAGVDIKTISERAGHADIGITLGTYSHFLKESDIEAAKKIGDVFCGETKKGQDNFAEILILACEQSGRKITPEQKVLLQTIFSAKAV